ncbi:hypothetical protein ACF1HJ_24395 [Streptomyces sp. NPDC013978]|uniref:hypothetical protein n=1 Tax=Streptomyces TaxID=1883 RepID=UPI001EFB2E85|nr:hypothetical protein [Streptomyces deccanensis]ULR52853.1 hypothetical protein L3078_28240 [Streptomyces deccanensis]
MRVKRSIATVTTALAASLAVGVTLAPAAAAGSGDGTCSSSDICVFNDLGHRKSDGYYDLGSPALKNFHGRYYFNDGAYIGDSISSWDAGSGTSCTGFKFWVNVDHRGASIQIAKGTEGNFSSPFTMPYNDIISSYSKYGCP